MRIEMLNQIIKDYNAWSAEMHACFDLGDNAGYSSARARLSSFAKLIDLFCYTYNLPFPRSDTDIIHFMDEKGKKHTVVYRVLTNAN